ncbi:MAG: TetR family transcriptional regulator [Myxococcota bacterium]
MSTTAERIAAAALRLFNRRGYASTSLTAIAKDVGISQGNLSYHFPTKLDLALHLSGAVHSRSEARRAALVPGDVADDYVESLRFSMDMSWHYRFFLRDRGIFEDPDAVVPPSPVMVASLEERRGLIRRIHEEGLFRADAGVEIDVFSRALWILSRHWMDHLREMEAKEEIGWADAERGIRHHFALLLPALTAAGKRRFEAALERASREHQP